MQFKPQEGVPTGHPEGGMMTIIVKAYANADDVLIAWRRINGPTIGWDSSSNGGTTQPNK
jgi:hypothetical protein